MNDGRGFESFLARLYTDAGLRERFLAAPAATARAAGLGAADAAALATIDRAGLAAATASLAHKRATQTTASWWTRWTRQGRHGWPRGRP